MRTGEQQSQTSTTLGWYDLSLQNHLSKVVADPPIDLTTVNFEFKRPEAVRERLGRTFSYFYTAEGEVSLNVRQVETLISDVDEYTAQFLTSWDAQEGQHSVLFGRVLETLELPLPKINRNKNMSAFRIGGVLSKNIPEMRDIFMLNYLSRGAMHERYTAGGYTIIGNIMTEMHEEEFVRTAIKPVFKQESRHLGYYRPAAKKYAANLSPWQVQAAEEFTAEYFRPVAASSKQRLVEIGRMQRDFADYGVDEVADHVQDIADDIFSEGSPEGTPRILRATKALLRLVKNEDAPRSPKYVRDVLEYCVELSELEDAV